MPGFQCVPKEDTYSYDYARKHPGNYELGADSITQPGIPQGKITELYLPDSKQYPGVPHTASLYVPQQYDGSQEVCLIVFFDGALYLREAHVSTVLDNLIHKREIPLMLAVFLNPGKDGDGLPIYGGDDNRSAEYDSVDGSMASFLEDEVIARLKKEYRLADQSVSRAVCGISSGGNAAFAAAWNRPDLLGKVISHCGSFTAIRGGHLFHEKVRKEEKKPLRIFLQTGEHDLNIIFGDWLIANQQLASALKYKGYDYQLVVGTGAHALAHGASILPDTLRWIWNDVRTE